ncbi:putative minor fimbrial subunit StfE [Serratia quinivorans]|nr:fimbrial protein [Serratia quinivorans]SPZ65782.1 putative minor fimbrial subunit StfE [Serratia quinivorans]VEI74027.1 putative minor fimbrial subunit StfE [Serratia quinivorans]
MMQNKHILRAAAACSLAVLLGGLPVRAEENMRFLGTLISPPPCIINGGQMIEVNFGDELVTSRIDGVNYRKDIDYSLDCRNAGANSVQMQIQGNAATFDGSVLATVERSELGIALKTEAGPPMNINTWHKIQFGATPKLAAVPVKATGSQLQAGSFTAGATMLIEYQ